MLNVPEAAHGLTGAPIPGMRAVCPGHGKRDKRGAHGGGGGKCVLKAAPDGDV